MRIAEMTSHSCLAVLDSLNTSRLRLNDDLVIAIRSAADDSSDPSGAARASRLCFKLAPALANANAALVAVVALSKLQRRGTRDKFFRT